MGFSDSFFAAKFGITRRDLENYLSDALVARRRLCRPLLRIPRDQLDQHRRIHREERHPGVSLGVGVRVIAGERTGYAYSDDLSPEKIRHAAQVAAMIAAGPAKVEKTPLERRREA